MTDKKAKSRASIVAVFGLLLTTFVLINSREFTLGAFIYIVLSLIALSLYRQWDYFGKPGKLVGIDGNWKKDFLTGIGFGIGTIVLGTFIPAIGALGIPNVQSIAGTVGRFIIICISAPIFEEIFFRDFVLDFFDDKFIDMPFFVANIIQAVMFSFYHLYAYGENLGAVQGSFITAALMGLIFGFVRSKQNSIAGTIGYHATLNTYLGFVRLAVIVGIGLPLM